MHADRLLCAFCLLLAASSAPAALYRWVDETGRVQYSDKPPTEKDKDGVQMNSRGIVVRKLESGSSDEKKANEAELARRKLEEAKAAEQRKRDSALLLSFSTTAEIDMKRDREVQSLDAMIVMLREQERNSNQRLADDRRRLELLSKRNKSAPDAMKEDMQREEVQLKVIREEIERRQQEIVATRTKYDALKKRYQELREEQSPGSAEPSASTAPGKK